MDALLIVALAAVAVLGLVIIFVLPETARQRLSVSRALGACLIVVAAMLAAYETHERGGDLDAVEWGLSVAASDNSPIAAQVEKLAYSRVNEEIKRVAGDSRQRMVSWVQYSRGVTYFFDGYRLAAEPAHAVGMLDEPASSEARDPEMHPATTAIVFEKSTVLRLYAHLVLADDFDALVLSQFGEPYDLRDGQADQTAQMAILAFGTAYRTVRKGAYSTRFDLSKGLSFAVEDGLEDRRITIPPREIEELPRSRTMDFYGALADLIAGKLVAPAGEKASVAQNMLAPIDPPATSMADVPPARPLLSQAVAEPAPVAQPAPPETVAPLSPETASPPAELPSSPSASPEPAAREAPSAPAPVAQATPSVTAEVPSQAVASLPVAPAPIEPPAPAGEQAPMAPATIATAQDAPRPAAGQTANEATSAAADAETAVLDRTIAWAKAWELRDFDRYRSFYKQGFAQLPGETADAWLARRRAVLGRAGKLHIVLYDLAARPQDGGMNVSFRQTYEAPGVALTSSKTLIWVQQDGVWVISAEIVNEEHRGVR